MLAAEVEEVAVAVEATAVEEEEVTVAVEEEDTKVEEAGIRVEATRADKAATREEVDTKVEEVDIRVEAATKVEAKATTLVATKSSTPTHHSSSIFLICLEQTLSAISFLYFSLLFVQRSSNHPSRFPAVLPFALVAFVTQAA